MSFGFAVGDFIAVGKLIKDITDCLRSAGGARSEYQELMKELDALKAALHHLDQLNVNTTPSAHIDTIKLVTTSCKQRLEGFRTRVEKYYQSLGAASRTNVWRGTADKLGWSFCRKEEVEQLQRDLHTYNSIIGIHLAQYGVERLEAIGKETNAACTQVSGQLHHTQNTLEQIGKDISSQATVLSNLHALVSGLHQLLFSEMKSSIAHLGGLVNKVFTSTQQIYAVVLEIRDSKKAVDTRWTYFQDPFVVEDALGRKFPVPSEFDYDMLDNIIRHRFKKGTGSYDVKLGNYELLKTKQRSMTITAASQLLPGTAILMAVIVRAHSKRSCPMPQCTSPQANPCPGGGFICSLCDVWFDQSTKKIQEVDLVLRDLDWLSSSTETWFPEGMTVYHDRDIFNSKGPDLRNIQKQDELLRNVRIAYRDQPCRGNMMEISFCTEHLTLRAKPVVLHCPIPGCSANFMGLYGKGLARDNEVPHNRRMRCYSSKLAESSSLPEVMEGFETDVEPEKELKDELEEESG